MRKKGPTSKPRKPRADSAVRLMKQRFARRVAAGVNGTKAVLAEKPHLTPRAAAVRAVTWRDEPQVAAEIAKAQSEAIDYLQADVNQYFEQLHAIATFDPASVVDARGRLMALKDMPRMSRYAIQGIDVVFQNLKAGDGVVDEVAKIRTVPKIDALRTLLQAHGKLITRSEKGKPGEFDKMDREQTLKELEKLAPTIGLHLVKKTGT